MELQQQLAAVALRIAAPSMGILAADESTSTIGKRLEKVGLQNTEVGGLCSCWSGRVCRDFARTRR